ncbi:DNA adenine methylase [Spirochaetota bacterium]|nr:DNA adenine methylase [Spirochaetota bacterium]
MNNDVTKARPFIKWVGGKNAIAHVIGEYLPAEIDRYYEPFVGSGALFFSIASRVKKATLSDNNQSLMVTYKVVQQRVHDLIARLKQHAKKHSKEYYYKVRSWHDLTDDLEIAARMIYLNKTCYNGLYRVNSKNQFNVPLGSYKNPTICDAPNLIACSVVLQNVNIIYRSFDKIVIEPNSIVYCDPPYHATYNQYHAEKFNDSLQQCLSELAKEWHKRGSFVLISNSNTDFIRSLYGRLFKVIEVEAPRSVSCKERGKETELLIITQCRAEKPIKQEAA